LDTLQHSATEVILWFKAGLVQLVWFTKQNVNNLFDESSLNQYASRRFVIRSFFFLAVMPIQCDIHFTQIPRFKGRNVTYSHTFTI